MLILYILLFLAILILIIILVLQMPQFGKVPQAGPRLDKIRQSIHYKNDEFKNIDHTPVVAEGYSYFDFFKLPLQKVEHKEPSQQIPFIKTDLKNLPVDKPIFIWFGHSSYLLQIEGKKILIDPVFSGFASPFPFGVKAFKGSNEYQPEDFPDIDLLILTHDHYDHLDYKTVSQLKPKVKKVLTSLGTGEHLVHWGYDGHLITELDWWESFEFDNKIKFTATPARHFSGRGLIRAKAFWNSYVLKTPDYQLFLGGDSGYGSHFKEIGEKFGSFDLAILECGQYNELWHYIHAYPEESLIITKEINAKMILPVHWAKFVLAQHSWTDSVERITNEAIAQNQPYTTPMIGEIVVIGENYPKNHWWKNIQ
jgi:L-ascorbate metabolism protein UlaG (beta-lactamase superfamily)